MKDLIIISLSITITLLIWLVIGNRELTSSFSVDKKIIEISVPISGKMDLSLLDEVVGSTQSSKD